MVVWMFNLVEHEKSFINSGPDLVLICWLIGIQGASTIMGH